MGFIALPRCITTCTAFHFSERIWGEGNSDALAQSNHKIMVKELPELQRRAAKYQASLQSTSRYSMSVTLRLIALRLEAHEDGLALHQTLCSLAEVNASSELSTASPLDHCLT